MAGVFLPSDDLVTDHPAGLGEDVGHDRVAQLPVKDGALPESPGPRARTGDGRCVAVHRGAQ